MKSTIDSSNGKVVVDGATIRIIKNQEGNKSKVSATGVVSLLPKVQVSIGDKLEVFMNALEISRLPLAIKRVISKGNFDTYEVIRLQTGNIKEAKIGILTVYSGYIVGVTYNREILANKELRRLVKLSAMHQLCICDQNDSNRMFKAANAVSILTSIPRDELIVSETSKGIKVKVKYKSRFNLPIYYIFTLTKAGIYNLLSVTYNLNDIALKLKGKATE